MKKLTKARDKKINESRIAAKTLFMTVRYSHVSALCGALFVAVISTALYCWYLYGHTSPYTVPGTLLTVDRCDRHCFVSTPGPAGCIDAVSVTLQWSIGAHFFNQSDVAATASHCGSMCCHELVGEPVQVELDPQQPDDALTFWRADAVPYNVALLTGASVSTAIALLCLPAVCYCFVQAGRDEQKSRIYQQL